MYIVPAYPAVIRDSPAIPGQVEQKNIKIRVRKFGSIIEYCGEDLNKALFRVDEVQLGRSGASGFFDGQICRFLQPLCLEKRDSHG